MVREAEKYSLNQNSSLEVANMAKCILPGNSQAVVFTEYCYQQFRVGLYSPSATYVVKRMKQIIQSKSIFLFPSRGKMIPSDLERRILEAKQKVSFCRDLYPAHISIFIQQRTKCVLVLFLKEDPNLNSPSLMRM